MTFVIAFSILVFVAYIGSSFRSRCERPTTTRAPKPTPLTKEEEWDKHIAWLIKQADACRIDVIDGERTLIYLNNRYDSITLTDKEWEAINAY